MRNFLLLMVALAAVSCATEQQERTVDAADKTIEQMREESLAKIDAQACADAGGEIRQEGMLGMWRCVTPYPDAGEVCQSASDCAGRCLADDDVTDYDAAPGEMKGVCEADDSPFGCFAEIDAGRRGAALCVD
ncbi:MAG: hypothetical protein KDA46_08985 [Parvularculaceae bacterium]|nr:hypothetical protein [Parvularculaceae bacterium]